MDYVETDPYPNELHGCRLERTCIACPEQYDVFYGDKQIGYLRLRHGIFRAHYPDVSGEVVYIAHPQGDGIFSKHERVGYLHSAIIKLLDKHKETP